LGLLALICYGDVGNYACRHHTDSAYLGSKHATVSRFDAEILTNSETVRNKEQSGWLEPNGGANPHPNHWKTLLTTPSATNKVMFKQKSHYNFEYTDSACFLGFLSKVSISKHFEKGTG
jgi:hypothetical protein